MCDLWILECHDEKWGLFLTKLIYYISSCRQIYLPDENHVHFISKKIIKNVNKIEKKYDETIPLKTGTFETRVFSNKAMLNVFVWYCSMLMQGNSVGIHNEINEKSENKWKWWKWDYNNCDRCI